jgi:hypothetical protein
MFPFCSLESRPENAQQTEEGGCDQTILDRMPCSEIEAPPCHLAGVISRQTGFADVRPHGVDRARRRDADVAHKGRAAIAVAPHSSPLVIDECARDPGKRGLIFQ